MMERAQQSQELLQSNCTPKRVKLERNSYFERYKDRQLESHGDIAEVFHENSKYTQEVSQKLGRSAGLFETDGFQWSVAQHDPQYPTAPIVELPAPASSLNCSLEDALLERRTVRSYGSNPVDISSLSTLLRYGCGQSESVSVELSDGEEVTRNFRTYPSGGALYPVEAYVVAFGCEGLSPGVYHYEPTHHQLRRLSMGEATFESEVADIITSPEDVVDVTDGSALIALTGAFGRAKAKYGPRGYRFTLQESGHLAQNLQLVAPAIGAEIALLGSFDDYETDELLGVDGVEEGTVYTLLVGKSKREGPR